MAAEERALLLAAPPEPGTRKLALGAGAVALVLVVVALLTTIASLGVRPTVQLQASTSAIVGPATLPSLPAEHIALNRSDSVTQAAASTRVATDAIPAIAVGDGSLALVTAASLDSRQLVVVVELPDQTAQFAEVVESAETAAATGLVVVRLSYASTPVAIADHRPTASEFVTVIDSQGGTVSSVLSDMLDELSPTESTPILNANGALVGLWTSGGSRSRAMLIPVDADKVSELIAAATSASDADGATGESSESAD